MPPVSAVQSTKQPQRVLPSPVTRTRADGSIETVSVGRRFGATAHLLQKLARTVAGTGSGALPTLTVIGHGVGEPSLPSLAAARLEEVYAAAIAYASTAQQLAQPPPCETVLPVFVPESFYAWREDAALASTDTALASV